MEKQPEEKHVKERDSLDYIADSEEVVASESPKFAYLAIILMVAVVLFGIVWAGFSNIEEVTNAEGKIIVSSELQVVQHLEGGIVDKIYVKEGQKVKKGQLLIKLDKTRSSAEHREGLAKLNVLKAEMIRLSAEAMGKSKLVFDEDFLVKNQNLVEHTVQLFESNTKSLVNALAVLDKSYSLMQEELDIIKPLAESGVMSDIDLIRLERQLNALGGQILEKKESVKQSARDSLNKIKAEYSMLNERLKGTGDRMDRTNIYSPVDGIVNQLYVSTVREVIQPGEKIIDIVPSGEQLTIQAYVRPVDIGFIHPGQHTIIKISAYDYSIYGGLDGKVVSISPDSITDESGQSFYEAKIKADSNSVMGKDGKPMHIIPGMTVTVSIVTGKKTILNYLLKPFYKARHVALRER